MSNYPKKVYLNGDILEHKDAKISVFDRGFLFGDGIYEVMNKVNGSFFFGEEHLNRLSECLSKINIDLDITSLPDKINNLIKVSDLNNINCLIYIQVTRGVSPRKHSFPATTKPTIMMYALPFELPEINKSNIGITTLTDYRWHRCDIKSISLLGNVIANDFAVKKETQEAVFVRNNSVTEGSHSNIFFVKDGVVYTHPANKYILNGITRQIVLQLCDTLNIKVIEKAILEKDIATMDEAFLTGTTTQIASIQLINKHQFYDKDDIGPVTQKLQEAFLEVKKNYRSTIN